MQLIGVLDSPYVRRVAIALQWLGLRFEHKPLSAFSNFAQFAAINPVVKAPTLVTDDGVVLMDSSLILSYAQSLAGAAKNLWPQTRPQLEQALALEGLALAACEKSVQIVIETRLRPADKIHAAWLERITAQMLDAFDALEIVLRDGPGELGDAHAGLAGITIAVAWQFARQTLPELFAGAAFPTLQAHSARTEALPLFAATPHSFTAVLR